MTTHTWNPSDSGYIYDTTDYTDGTAFADGDTLVVGGGQLNAVGSNGNVGALFVGTYQFNTDVPSESLAFTNIALPVGATLATVGQNLLTFNIEGQFVNNGLVQSGSSSATGDMKTRLFAQNVNGTPGSFANNGTVLLQNHSTLLFVSADTTNVTLMNAANGVISINNGSYLGMGSDSLATSNYLVNNGLIAVNGAVGAATELEIQSNYQGTGLISIRGAPGDLAGDTFAYFEGIEPNSTVDIASGTVHYLGYQVQGTNHYPTIGGAVNFLDNNGWLSLSSMNATEFQSTVNGFQAGDRIYLLGSLPAIGTLTYDASSHLLSAYFAVTGGLATQIKVAGTYTTSDFQVTNEGSDSYITTTSTANAHPAFAYKDATTGASGGDAGVQYTGPVSYLQSQYVWSGADGASVTAHMPDVFLKGGPGADALAATAGSNVLDGQTGSNFLVGSTGADGGTDTFFLDGSVGTTWDTVVNFHKGDGVTLWGYVPGTSAMAWAANDGTAGYTGATIHAAFNGASVNGSVTFAGVSLATAQSQFSVSSGTVGGRSYLYVHDNG